MEKGFDLISQKRCPFCQDRFAYDYKLFLICQHMRIWYYDDEKSWCGIRIWRDSNHDDSILLHQKLIELHRYNCYDDINLPWFNPFQGSHQELWERIKKLVVYL